MSADIAMSGSYLVSRYTIMEIPLLTTGSGPQYNFPVNNFLTGRKIYKIEVYSNNDITRSPISTGNLTWTPAMITAASLTIHCFDPTQLTNSAAASDWIKQLPVWRLHSLFNTNTAAVNSSNYNEFQMKGHLIDFNNSFVQFVATQTFDVNYSALFGVYYE